jgi:hypothetical protein
VDARYRDIGFPFPRLDAPPFVMKCSWTGARFLAYLATWSAVGAYRRSTGEDPLPAVREALVGIWPPDAVREVCWPLTVVAGRPQR